MIAVIECGKNSVNNLPEILDELKQEFRVTDNEFEICKADKIILIGEGEACDGARQLNMLNLYSVLRIIKKPILGIGLGMELMTESVSNENVHGLGIFPITSQKIPDEDKQISGWKEVEVIGQPKLFIGINKSDKFYFSGKYVLPQSKYSTSLVENGNKYSASVEKDNAYGVQFHPELSGEAGKLIIKNFTTA
jgi:glutamine amidotransferase